MLFKRTLSFHTFHAARIILRKQTHSCQALNSYKLQAYSVDKTIEREVRRLVYLPHLMRKGFGISTMYNVVIFLIQILIVTLSGAFFAFRSLAWLTGWLSLLSVIMNIFVLKQIDIVGFEVTAADVYMIGMLSAINCAREIHGKDSVNTVVRGSWAISLVFVLLTQLHLAIQPSANDNSQMHFLALFSPSLRIFFASLCTMIIVQVTDLKLFGLLKKMFKERAFGTRTGLSLIFSQTLDTLLFSFLGLYGLVSHLSHVILFALLAKSVVTFVSIPMVTLSKKIHVFYKKRPI